jgi:hypothetical protein
MLLPEKHIKLSESILGLGSFIIDSLKEPKHFNQIIREFHAKFESKAYPSDHPLENLLLAVDFLYAIGTITLFEDGRLVRCG